MPVTGGASRKVLSDVSSPISFSPDGQQFAYEVCLSSGTRVDLKIANADGSGSRLLVSFLRGAKTYQTGPSWSRDGRKIAVALEDELYTVGVADGRVETVHAAKSGLVGRPGWLKDEIVFAEKQGDNSESQLWTVNTATHLVRRITNDVAEYGLVLEASKNGKVLLTTVNNLDAQVWSATQGDPGGGQPLTTGPTPSLTVLELPEGRLLTVTYDGTTLSLGEADRNHHT
jgi:Tol biopolymer transport system component